jgi:uncharacterized protein (DUF1015 family)
MVVVAPLPALRPRPELAAQVAAVPYDVVDTAEARALADGNPFSYLHVARPEIDMPPGTDPHSRAVYEAGHAALARLVAEGTLVRDPGPALYLYRLAADGHSQTGVMGRCSVDDYDAGRIKKHEKTRPDKEEDRTRHLLALGCHPEPVFLTYRRDAEAARRIAAATEAAPLYRFTAADGVEHTLWRLAGEEATALSRAFAGIDALYVADGHHRCAAASRARAERRGSAGGAGSAPRPDDFLLAAVFPDDEVRILPYNRVVDDLGGRSPAAFLDALRGAVAVEEGAPPRPERRGRASMYLDGRWYGLDFPRRDVEAADPVESMDAAILQARVLGPLLGIDDPRTAEGIDFVGGSRGTAELERRVDAGAAVAFSLHPVSVAELMAVADAGRVLPPKSTWFEPKLRSGLLVHEL